MPKSRLRVAEELELAQEAYERAVEEHAANDNPESRKSLEQARQELEKCQLRSKLAATQFRCPKCHWHAVGERWQLDGGVGEELKEGDMTIRHVPVRPVPHWAEPHVREGLRCVTRYYCPECNEQFAVKGADI